MTDRPWGGVPPSKTMASDPPRPQVHRVQSVEAQKAGSLAAPYAFLSPCAQIETLVTIHVHQRDVMNDLATLHRQKRISDANDFEWLKQVRAVYFRRTRYSDTRFVLEAALLGRETASGPSA